MGKKSSIFSSQFCLLLSVTSLYKSGDVEHEIISTSLQIAIKMNTNIPSLCENCVKRKNV